MSFFGKFDMIVLCILAVIGMWQILVIIGVTIYWFLEDIKAMPRKILDWFIGATVYLLIVLVEGISDAWDYITMRNIEDTRFD